MDAEGNVIDVPVAASVEDGYRTSADVVALNAELEAAATNVAVVQATIDQLENGTLPALQEAINIAQATADSTVKVHFEADLGAGVYPVLNDTSDLGDLYYRLDGQVERWLGSAQGWILVEDTVLAETIEALRAAEQQLNTLNTVTLPALQDELDAAELTIAQHTTDLSGLDGRLQTAETAVSTARGELDTLNNTTIPNLNIELGKKLADVPGAIASTHITDDAITSPKIATGAVTADSVAANAIYADAVQANAIVAGKIATDAVTANTIAADAVTANKIAANAVTAAKIDAGTITSREIASNSIAAEKLLIGDFEILLDNPALLGTGTAIPAGWENVSGTSITVTSGLPGRSILFAGTAGNHWLFNTRWVEVAPDAFGVMPQYYFQLKGQNQRDGLLRMELEFYDQDNTYIGRAYGSPISSGTMWTTVSTTAQAPTGARKMRARIVSYGSAANTGEAWAGLPIVRRLASGTLIEDGAITTGKVKANAITANEMAVGTITAESGILANAVITEAKIANLAVTNAKVSGLSATKITTDTLGADRIGARTITADKVVLSGARNAIPGGDAEGGRYMPWAAPLTWQTTDMPAGLAGAFTGSAGQGSFGTPGLDTGGWDVEPGEEYIFEVWLKADVPNSRMYIECRDQDSASAGRSSDTGIAGDVNPGSTGGYLVQSLLIPTVWTRFRSVYKMTGTANRVRIGTVYMNHVSGTERTAVQSIAGMSMRRRHGGELIVDGAVTALKIAANAVTASKIDANAVTAAKIHADAINGKTITGATIRTSASGQRVEMTGDNAVSFYGSSGLRTIMQGNPAGVEVHIGGIPGGTAGIQHVYLGNAHPLTGSDYGQSTAVLSTDAEGGIEKSGITTGVLDAKNRILQGGDPIAYKQAAGVNSVPSVPANNSVNVTVSMPSGRFNVAPIVTATTDDDRLTVAVTSRTTTSAVIRLTNRSALASATSNVMWQAVQMLTTSAGG